MQWAWGTYHFQWTPVLMKLYYLVWKISLRKQFPIWLEIKKAVKNKKMKKEKKMQKRP